jgi:hypothetical protein
VTLRKDIGVKFKQDFSQRTAGEYEKYVLFCTAHLTTPQKRQFTHYCLETLQALFVPYDIEALLDSSLKFTILVPLPSVELIALTHLSLFLLRENFFYIPAMSHRLQQS